MRRIPYIEWATHDEHGFIDGIREDAPEWAKKAYEEDLNDDSGII